MIEETPYHGDLIGGSFVDCHDSGASTNRGVPLFRVPATLELSCQGCLGDHAVFNTSAVHTMGP